MVLTIAQPSAVNANRAGPGVIWSITNTAFFLATDLVDVNIRQPAGSGGGLILNSEVAIQAPNTQANGVFGWRMNEDFTDIRWADFQIQGYDLETVSIEVIWQSAAFVVKGTTTIAGFTMTMADGIWENLKQMRFELLDSGASNPTLEAILAAVRHTY